MSPNLNADEPYSLPHNLEEVIIRLGEYISSFSRERLPAVTPFTTMFDLGFDDFHAIEEFMLLLEGELGEDLAFSTRVSMTSWTHTTTLLDVAQSIRATLARPANRRRMSRTQSTRFSPGFRSDGPA